MTIGEKIYSLRNEAHMTQEELAGRMGVSRQSVSKWESGISTPELEKLRMLAELFKVPVGDLIDPDNAGKNDEAAAGRQPDSVNNPETTDSPEDSNHLYYDDNREADPSSEQEEISFLKKQIKKMKRVSYIQDACILILCAALVFNFIWQFQMNAKVQLAQDTAEAAMGNSVVYISPDSGSDEEDPFDSYAEISSFDAEAQTMTVDFTVIPDNSTADTQISITLTDDNGENTQIMLEDNNSRYTARAELPMQAYPDALIVMEDSSGRQTYQGYFDELIYLEDMLLPQMELYVDLTDLDYNSKKKQFSGMSTFTLQINTENDYYREGGSALSEASELDQVTIRIRDYEQEWDDGDIIWEEALSQEELEELKNNQYVELQDSDWAAPAENYNGNMLCLEVELTNHYLQEKKNFFLDVWYGSDGTRQTYYLQGSEEGFVSVDY